mmetsp:Transcript_18696/g.35800  ORF Transcript_18696/g.35800 Transcript_18696/m.35800 type:complete len:208 (-) Transcript_18696:3103-3726(-)
MGCYPRGRRYPCGSQKVQMGRRSYTSPCNPSSRNTSRRPKQMGRHSWKDPINELSWTMGLHPSTHASGQKALGLYSWPNPLYGVAEALGCDPWTDAVWRISMGRHARPHPFRRRRVIAMGFYPCTYPIWYIETMGFNPRTNPFYWDIQAMGLDPCTHPVPRGNSLRQKVSLGCDAVHDPCRYPCGWFRHDPRRCDSGGEKIALGRNS